MGEWKSHHFYGKTTSLAGKMENSLLLWPFSMALLNCQRVVCRTKIQAINEWPHSSPWKWQGGIRSWSFSRSLTPQYIRVNDSNSLTWIKGTKATKGNNSPTKTIISSEGEQDFVAIYPDYIIWIDVRMFEIMRCPRSWLRQVRNGHDLFCFILVDGFNPDERY